MGYNDLARELGPARRRPHLPYLRRRPDRRPRLGRLQPARPVRGRVQLGPLGRRQQRRRLLLAGRPCAAQPDGGGANCGANPNIPGFTAPPRLPNTPANQAEYDRGLAGRQRPSAPAALRPPDPRAGAARRHPRAPGRALGRRAVHLRRALCATCRRRGRRTSSRRSRSAAPPPRAASRRPASSRPNMMPTATCSTACSTASTSARNRASTSSRPASGNISCSGIRRSPTGCASPGWPAARRREFRNPFQTTTTLDAPTSTATRSTSATAAASRRSPIRSTSTSTTGRLRHHRHSARRHAVEHHAVGNPHPSAGRGQQLHHRPRRPRLGLRARPAHAEGRRLLPRI